MSCKNVPCSSSVVPLKIIRSQVTYILHPEGGNRKRSEQSMDADQKSIETAFSIVICRQSGDKWRSKTLFLTFFLSTFIDSIDVFDCRLPGVKMFILCVLDDVITQFLSILEICRPKVYIGVIVVYSQTIEKCNPCALNIGVIIV